MRYLTDHIVNPANDQLQVTAEDEPSTGGANHLYMIRGFDTKTNESCPFTARHGQSAQHATVLFQNGPIGEKGVNGITHEALLAILADRLTSFQNGPYASAYNARALEGIQQAQKYLLARTRDRMAQGIEGTHEIGKASNDPLGDFLGAEPILQFFAFAHLPAHLQAISAPFGDLAHVMVNTLPRCAERSVALRKLLEAKDAAVRANLSKPEGTSISPTDDDWLEVLAARRGYKDEGPVTHGRGILGASYDAAEDEARAQYHPSLDRSTDGIAAAVEQATDAADEGSE